MRVSEARVDFCAHFSFETLSLISSSSHDFMKEIWFFLFKKIKARWTKLSGDEQFVRNHTDGKDLDLNPGQSD